MAASPSPSPSPSLSAVRSWRMAFLTLRDETLTSPPSTAVVHLLNHLIFSNSDNLIRIASDLPSHEVTSDLMFLMEVARTTADSAALNDDIIHTFTQLSHFVYDVSHRVSLDINSSYWALMLDSFGRMVEIFLGKAGRKRVLSGNVVVRALKHCLETTRCLVSVYQRKCSLSENTELLNFLISIVACSHAELYCSSSFSANQRYTAEFGKRIPRYNSLWEVQTITFTMISEVFSRVGSSLSVDMWQSTIQVLKNVMDVLASKNLLVEDNVMAKFYTSLLHCLHLVLIDPKGPLSDHVAGFVAALRMFFIYGIANKSQLLCPLVGHKKEISSLRLKLNLGESSKSDSGPYRPPHLRKQDLTNLQPLKAQESVSFSVQEFSTIDYTSSDSDYSDNDGPAKDADNIRCFKARVAAIVCIQDLCRADPKLFTAQWTMLLPSSDVLQPRKYEATLMTCLLFDPYLKARIAAASTVVAMLDGPASVFLQVAELKESTKCGSFTALSSSLGQMLMQLHIGILYLIQHETHGGLLASLFKILMLLISSTPYSRMPGDLMPNLISSLRARIEEGFPPRSDETNLLAVAINCLTAALSASPSSPKVRNLFVEELHKGFVEPQEKSGILSTIFRYSEPVNSPTISLEALQAVRAVSHNYPDIIVVCWEQVSSTVLGFLRLNTLEVPTRPWKDNIGKVVGSIGDKVITAAIKVRAASVTCFAGITSSVFSSLPKEKQDFILTSSVNAALNDEVSSVRSAACRAIGVITCFPQIAQSAEILGKFIHAADINTRNPLVLVRITASWALANICDSLHHCINAVTSERCSVDLKVASHLIVLLIECSLRLTKDGDKIKANAVRALGNLSRFVQFTSQPGIFHEHVDVMGLSLISDSAEELPDRSDLNDKQKEKLALNSFQPASLEDSRWLGRMVQAFLSCVATGNVKVQWNVCHALSNLFLNGTLKLGNMDWAPSVFSILLLLLRDSPNYKIRIQAAAALAVPATILDYGGSFSDVIQGVEHTVENLSSDQITPSSFKYRIALEKQLTSTMLHVLALASSADHPPVKDFLVKKASFLEEWFKMLCLSLGETSTQLEAENNSTENQKKGMISRAIRSLIEVYESRDHLATAQKFNKLADSIP
ncbi:hypothetical protein ACSBR1_023804 [Camellia fascicularis]